MKKQITFLGFVMLMIIFFGTIYAVFFRSYFYKIGGGEIEITSIRSEKDTVVVKQVFAIDEFIYECDRNGYVKLNQDGETIWSKSYYMESPVAKYMGEYSAVGDITGKQIFVFNHEGFVYEIKEDNQLIDFYINKEGFVVTVMEKESQNFINYYSNEGQLLVSRGTRFYEDGYPIDVVTSDDVTKMVTGYLSVNENRLQTKITFFGFEDQYEDYDEYIIGGFSYDHLLLSGLYWLGEDYALAVMDEKIVLYNCESEPKVVMESDVSAEIENVCLDSDGFVVWYGDSIKQSEVDHSNSVVIYDLEGEVKSVINFDEHISLIAPADDGFYVLTGTSIIKYRNNRREWFGLNYLNAEAFYELTDQKFLVITQGGYDILSIRKQ